MRDEQDKNAFGQEPSEYHIVRPERGLYSDAEYSVPREGRTPYGYNPSRYYAAADDRNAHRGQLGLRTILALCLVCVVVAGILGTGGLYLISRSRQTARPAADGFDAFYADAGQSAEPAGPLLLTAPQAGAAPMAGEDLFAMACGQVVAVTSTSPQGGRLAGSGFFVTDDGYILTNYHVIQTGVLRGWPITVYTFAGDQYAAQVVGTEADSDLAVLKIDAACLAPAVLGDSQTMAVGQRVYAVGDPMGELNFSMTRGVISARDRLIATGESTLANMLQFDAPVNSGSSGGPLYNAYGQVVGVTTAKYQAAGVEGLGFAIPSSEACSIANQLITKGYVSGKAWLGLTLSPVTPSAARYFNIPEGAYIAAVEAGSNAEAAGLRPGDIVTAVDGAAVANADELVARIRTYRAGDSALLTVSRGGENIAIAVTFGEAAE